MVSLLALAGCGTADTSDEAPVHRVEYFFGAVETFMADGLTPLGSTQDSLVQRSVLEAEKTIVEEVWWLGDSHFTTEMSQVDGTTTFLAADREGSFTGSLVYSGEAWNWAAWSYDITMSDGSGTLVGSGQLGVDGITTEKQFLSPAGSVQVVIREDLPRISEEEFVALRPATL